MVDSSTIMSFGVRAKSSAERRNPKKATSRADHRTQVIPPGHIQVMLEAKE